MLGGGCGSASTASADSAPGSLEIPPANRKDQSAWSWFSPILNGSLSADVAARHVARSTDVTAGQTAICNTLGRGLITEESGLSCIPNQSITCTSIQVMDCNPRRKSTEKYNWSTSFIPKVDIVLKNIPQNQSCKRDQRSGFHRYSIWSRSPRMRAKRTAVPPLTSTEPASAPDCP